MLQFLTLRHTITLVYVSAEHRAIVPPVFVQQDYFKTIEIETWWVD